MMLTILITAVVFLLVLSVLVMVHELGHFTAAKRFGIKVEEFGFGLPPRLWGKKVGETVYSINWLPIGGFVKLYGEDQDPTSPDGHRDRGTSSKEEKRAFFSRPVWQRAVVLVAGVCMNFLLAVVVLSYLFTQGVMVPTDTVQVDGVLPGSPAHIAGIAVGDIIERVIVPAGGQRIDGSAQEVPIKKSEDLITVTHAHLGQELYLILTQHGVERKVAITPRAQYPANEGPLGVAISVRFVERKYSVWEAPYAGTRDAIMQSWLLIQGIGITVWKFVTFQPVAKDVAGPIGIAQMTGEAIKFGNNAVLQLMGLLSLNLAIVNILPIPALDGGRLLFVVIETITGKRVKSSVERYAHQIGMIFLLFLILLVTVNDVVRIVQQNAAAIWRFLGMAGK